MGKIIIFIGGVIILVAGWLLFSAHNNNVEVPSQAALEQEEVMAEDNTNERASITAGSYVVDSEKSIVNWSGKKPLIDGYINTGEIRLSEGSIEVLENDATGSFVIAMDTLKVGLTAKKPDQETALEGHLKGDRWFDVAAYPTATFVINEVTPKTDSATSFTYTIAGDLTLKGQTHPVTFDAVIYQNTDGTIRAEAATEIDRTKWGITAGSASFFDNLADNAIDNMIALSFTLVATKK
jgi:polyisoprenoid-binding protein YceI